MLQKRFRIILWNYIVLCNGAIIPVHRQGKLSLAEWTNYNYREPEGHGTYAFGYDVEDPETNNIQFRNEEKLSNGSVIGSYGYLESTGNAFVVNYIADHNGYRAFVEDSSKLKNFKPPLLTPLSQRTVEKTSDYVQIRSKNEKNGEKFTNTLLRNESHEQHHIENKDGSIIEPINSYFETSKNEQKKMEPTRKKKPDSSFGKEKENNFYTKNIPNFHVKNGMILQKNNILGNRQDIIPRWFNYPIKKISGGKLKSSELQKRYETIPKNSDLNLISKGESIFSNRNNTENRSLNFKSLQEYFPNMLSALDEKRTEKIQAFPRKHNDRNNKQSNLIKKIKRHIKHEGIVEEKEEYARILTSHMNHPPLPAQLGPSCTNFQNSNGKNWPSRDSIVDPNTQMHSQILSSKLRHNSNNSLRKQVKNTDLEDNLKLFRIVTPVENQSTSHSSFKPSC